MWYAVLTREITLQDKFIGQAHLIRAGSIYQVQKYSQDEIHAIPVEGVSAKQFGKLTLTPAQARTIFTRPTRDFDNAVEESIMQSEANYC